MSIVFNKGVQVLETLQKHLMNITTSNGFNIEIKNVVIYNVTEFENLKHNLQLPAVFMSAEEVIEELANDEYLSSMKVAMFLMYKPSTQNDGVITDFSKVRSAIAEQLNTNGCLGLDFVQKAFVSSVQHPLYIIERQAYSFLMTIDIEYFFNSDDP